MVDGHRGGGEVADAPDRYARPLAEAAFAVLWDFLVPRDDADTADAIVCFGCRDLAVPRTGALLFGAGVAPLVVVTGANPVVGPEPEAEWFARHLRTLGVPEASIVIESRSTHTGENVVFGFEALAERSGPPTSVVAVSWPLAARRVRATIARHHPTVRITSAPALATPDRRWPATERTVRAALGEWDRLDSYGRRGWLTPQSAPPEVAEAVAVLRDLPGIGARPDVDAVDRVPARRPAVEPQ